MSNPLVRVVDIAALAELAHEQGTLLVVDNTFATPILTKPLDLGADFVMESLTKMIAGHSDVTLGARVRQGRGHVPQSTPTSASGAWRPTRSIAGWPSGAWRHCNLRMQAACKNAALLADWLARSAGRVA